MVQRKISVEELFSSNEMSFPSQPASYASSKSFNLTSDICGIFSMYRDEPAYKINKHIHNLM